MFYDKFVCLCKQKEVSPSKAAMDAGISKSLVTKWRTNQVKTPSADVLDKLSSYFGVSVSELLSEDDGSYGFCVGCGMRYNPNDEEECQIHEQRHNSWVAAVRKFGFCWHGRLRENKKDSARLVISDPIVPLSDKVSSQIVVFMALFSRSLEASDFDLEHIDFDAYVAMILGQGKGRHNIPDDVYDALVAQYGTKSGMPEGTYYTTKKSALTLVEKNKHSSIAERLNVVHIAGRDGSYEERYLTDSQLAAVKAIIDQLPDASGDL